MNKLRLSIVALAMLVFSMLPAMAQSIAPKSLTSVGTLFTVADTSGYASISIQVTSAGVGATISYEVSEDGTNWVSVAGFTPSSQATSSIVTTSTTAGIYLFPTNAKQFRARVSGYASGTVTAQATLRREALPKQAMQVGIATSLGSNNVGGYDKFLTLTPTVQNAAYSSGNAIGGLQTLAFFRGNGGSGLLNNVMVASKGGFTTPITFYVFQSNPTSSPCADKSAFSIAAADISKLVPSGPFVITPAGAVGAATASFGSQQVPISIQNQESTANIYVCAVVGASVTPASATDVVFSYGGIQD